jgi:diguanylate cyclase (GGDEF)-like protein/PAS domain S-box-containing protein
MPGRRAWWTRVRAPVLTALVLGVVFGEFLLLSAVYDRAKPVRTQRVVVAHLAGAVDAATVLQGAATPATLRYLDSTTTRSESALRREGLSAAALAPLSKAAAGLGATPSAGALTRLRSAVTALSARLAGTQRRIDDQAISIYVLLLLAASVGWFGWFRRLVARHRRLQRQVTEAQIRAVDERRLAALVRNASDVVAVLDVDSTLTYVTPSSAGMLGREPDELVGQRLVDLLVEEERERFSMLLTSRTPGGERKLGARMTHRDGREIIVEGVLTDLLDDPAVNGLLLTVRDVTEQRRLEERLSFQAFHDSLTGLANRQLFTDRLAHALERRGAARERLFVLFCDLDDFKNVNDSLGHNVGDQVLAAASTRFGEAVRSGDTAARLGGDEFAILLEDSDLDSATAVAERVQTLLAEPLEVDGRRITVRVSIGIAQAIPGESVPEEVLRNADVAMYWAKDRGKSAVAVYDSRLHAEALERLELRGDLQRALRRDELRLHYQPIVDVETGRVEGFEALVRWQHPSRGLVPPVLFVPMAEESGMIVALGRWVLERACRDGSVLRAPDREIEIAVNLSAHELARPEIVDEVLAVLSATGFPPRRLVLEITEGAILHDLATVAPRLTALRAHGIRIAIDDFGTGYSSLAYLSDLPVDILKVDKSFVDKVNTDPQHAAITAAIFRMSRDMRLTTVAEGVEEADQVDWLRAAKCVHAQGYFWSRPVERETAAGLIPLPTLYPAADRSR